MSEPGQSETTHRSIAKHIFEKFVKEPERKNRELWNESRFDVETGLPNGRGFKEFLEGLGSEWNRENKQGKNSLQGTLLVMDATKLKLANDKYGHRVGNEYLIKIATIIKDVIRKGDRAFRLGDHSDEFLLHLRGVADPDNVVSIMNRIDKSLEVSQAEFRKKYPEIVMSVSKCAVSYNNDRSPKEAFDKADTLMAEAKHKAWVERGDLVPTMLDL